MVCIARTCSAQVSTFNEHILESRRIRDEQDEAFAAIQTMDEEKVCISSYCMSNQFQAGSALHNIIIRHPTLIRYEMIVFEFCFCSLRGRKLKYAQWKRGKRYVCPYPIFLLGGCQTASLFLP